MNEQQKTAAVGDTLLRAGCALTATVAALFFAFLAVVWVLAVLR
jgi:hypothetical protein